MKKLIIQFKDETKLDALVSILQSLDFVHSVSQFDHETNLEEETKDPFIQDLEEDGAFFKKAAEKGFPITAKEIVEASIRVVNKHAKDK